MSESELYKELGILTNDRSKWKESLPEGYSLSDYDASVGDAGRRVDRAAGI